MGAKNIYENLKESREQEIKQKIDLKLKVKTRTLKANESLKTAVLTSLVDSKYEECESLLVNYTDNFTQFIDFQVRVEPYIQHCINLVRSIQVKRNFPKVTSMPIIKQQELMDRVFDDFNELRLYLVRVEAMHTEVICKDILSMKILIRTVFICAMIFTVVLALINIGSSGLTFINHAIGELSQMFTNLIL